MKKILQIGLLLISQVLWAQNLKVNPEEVLVPKQKHFTAWSFQIENVCHVGVKDALANTPLSFYSTIHGGKHICSHYSDASGNLSTSFDENQHPGFVLNRVPSATKNQKGYSVHFDKKEFIAKDIALKKQNFGYKISFKALADEEQAISYRIIEIHQDGTQKILQEGYPSSYLRAYTLSVNYSAKTNYQIEFYNGAEFRYAHNLYVNDKESSYTIYPTLTRTLLNLDFMAEFNSGSYTITNHSGQIVQQGKLLGQFNVLELNSFVKGTYVIYVELNGEQLKGKQIVIH